MWIHTRVICTNALVVSVLQKLAEWQGPLIWSARTQVQIVAPTPFTWPWSTSVRPSRSLCYTTVSQEEGIIPVALEGNCIWVQWRDFLEVAGGKGRKQTLFFPIVSKLQQHVVQCMNQMCHGSLLAAVFRCTYSEIQGTWSGEGKGRKEPCSDMELKCVCI